MLDPTAVPELSPSTISQWTEEYSTDPIFRLASLSIGAGAADTSLLDRSVLTAHPNVFSHVVENEGAPVLNQGSAGSCWLHAATNTLRTDVMSQYNLEEFELSIPYVFFYDKLEKANFFLQQVLETAHEESDLQLVQHLLLAPINDGGQFDLFANVVAKYGWLPVSAFPKRFAATSSSKLNWLLTAKLREWAQTLRAHVRSGGSVSYLLKRYQRETHRLISIFFGVPPNPDEPFTWEFTDKDKKFHRLEFTPKSFADKVLKFKAGNDISFLNDPRNTYNKVVKIDRLGNVVGSPLVHYLNLLIDKLAQVAIDRIKANKPVFFGTHLPVFMDSATGYMDPLLFDYGAIGYPLPQDKGSRIRFGQSFMTHAMVFTGVHLDEEGKPVRWRVQNSWGETSGIKGYYVMTHEYFKEYVYQVVGSREDAPALAKLFDEGKTDPVVLPPWDAMGALA